MKVKSVQKIAWNNERIELSSDDVDVVLTIKNPYLHDDVSVGDNVNDLFIQYNDDKIKALTDELEKEREAHAATIKHLEQVSAELSQFKPV